MIPAYSPSFHARAFLAIIAAGTSGLALFTPTSITRHVIDVGGIAAVMVAFAFGAGLIALIVDLVCNDLMAPRWSAPMLHKWRFLPPYVVGTCFLYLGVVGLAAATTAGTWVLCTMYLALGIECVVFGYQHAMKRAERMTLHRAAQ